MDQLVDESQVITGWCKECPPGTVWGCCPDDSVEYPPGKPSFEECEIVPFATSDQMDGNQVIDKDRIILSFNAYTVVYNLTTDTHRRLVVRAEDIPSGYSTQGTQNVFSCIAIGDKIVTNVRCILESNTKIGKLAVFDLDGFFLEWWEYPVFWEAHTSFDDNCYNNFCIAGPNSDNAVILMTSKDRQRNMAGTYETGLVGFDYYGNVVKIVRLPWIYEVNDVYAFDSITYSEKYNKYLIGNYSQYPYSGGYLQIADYDNFENTTKIRIPPSEYPELAREHFTTKLYTHTNVDVSKEVIIISGYSGNSGNTLSQCGFWICEGDGSNMKYVRQPEDPICKSNNYLGELEFNQGSVSAYSNYIIVGARGAGCDLLGIGNAYIFDLDGNYVDAVGLSAPMPGTGDRLGCGVFMTKDHVYMVGSRYTKKCKVRW